MSSPNTTGQFVLQIVGVTDGKVLSRPSQKHIMCEGLADVHINKKNIDVLAYSPSLGCDGLVESDMDVLVAPCPPDEEDIDVLVSMGKNIEPFTHSVFLSIFREENDIVEQKPVKSTLFNKIAPIPIVNEEEEEEKNVLPERDVIVVPASDPKPVEKVKAKRGRKKKGQDEAAPVENIVITPTSTSTSTITPSKIIELKQDGDSDDEEDETENEQCIAVNPKIAIELMESVIEKNLMKKLQPVTRFKRNIHIFLEGKVDSVFSFVGFCDDGIPFNMEVNNVPCAEYDHGERPDETGPGKPCPTSKNKFNKKTAYFPDKCCKNTKQMIKRIKDLITIKKESVTRCYLSYIVQRTDIDRFQFSLYNDEYRDAVIEAVEAGVIITPIVISWTREGIALFVTDEIPVVYPTH